ncbi:MAG: hypothetical protein KGS61_01300 [Verrucomicrobia bacterium]|nr:hypothetical protein [Verrucomicrobiota bacterium]
MFVYQSRLLKRGEVWFDQEPEPVPVDWIYYRQRPNPIANGRWRPFYTRLIDLAKSAAELKAEMEERTVRKIKEAVERDGTRWERRDAGQPGLLDEVQSMWNRFALAQHTPPLDRVWLDQLAAVGALEVGVAKDPVGDVLVYQLNYVAAKRAQQLIAVARYLAVPNAAMRMTINRANCLGHWSHMLALKERGIRSFDFGGWYPGTTDIRLLGMNAFKRGFGGYIVREFECEQILTLKGWAVLTVGRILHQLKNPRFARNRLASELSNATLKDCQVSAAFR